MKTLLQQNKDLDLRRYGKDVFTKASDGGSEGSVDEQSLITEVLNNILTPPFPIEGNVIYPDAYIFFDRELREFIVLDTVKALVNTYLSGITPAYKTEPTAENVYFILDGDGVASTTLENSYVREITINGITYYFLTERAA